MIDFFKVLSSISSIRVGSCGTLPDKVVTTIKMFIELLPGRRFRWSGAREAWARHTQSRHEVYRLVYKVCNFYVPVKALVWKGLQNRSFHFQPTSFSNGVPRKVIFKYKKYVWVMNLRDTADWIQCEIFNIMRSNFL